MQTQLQLPGERIFLWNQRTVSWRLCCRRWIACLLFGTSIALHLLLWKTKWSPFEIIASSKRRESYRMGLELVEQLFTQFSSCMVCIISTRCCVKREKRILSNSDAISFYWMQIEFPPVSNCLVIFYKFVDTCINVMLDTKCYERWFTHFRGRDTE